MRFYSLGMWGRWTVIFTEQGFLVIWWYSVKCFLYSLLLLKEKKWNKMQSPHNQVGQKVGACGEGHLKGKWAVLLSQTPALCPYFASQ